MQAPRFPARPCPRSAAVVMAVLAAVVTVATTAGCSGSKHDDDAATAPTTGSAPLQIRTLSNRADLVSGGDALIEVLRPAGVSSTVKVTANGRDVSDAFAQRVDGRVTGVVTGLVAGGNTIAAQADGAGGATLQVTNAPSGGPVYSGAQVTPFFCATTQPRAATGTAPANNASGLATEAIDAQCTIATEVRYYYRSTAAGCTLAPPDATPPVAYDATTVPAPVPPQANPCFRPWDPAAATPADLASTTTDQGLVVPYIVRVERGTMNRGIYDIAVLHSPTAAAWSGASPQPQWNGKVIYQLGASTGQIRRQIRPQTAWTAADAVLSRGFLVVMNSMTDSGTNSNRVLMAETVMMMKEHIIDHFGPIRYLLGNGCSGGSINAATGASIDPGLFDGVTTACAYPDAETTAIEVGDCVQLVEAYQKPEWQALMAGQAAEAVNAKKAAINGHPDQSGCHGWYNAFGSNAKVGNYRQRVVLDNASGAITTLPQTVNNCELPAGLVYDPQGNPGGARCNAWDWATSIWGKAPDGIRSFETRDNVGIQYGLKALLADAITAEEFVTVNEIAGGVDKDTNQQAARSTADSEALSIAYRSGVVSSGLNLGQTPIIDVRGWDDSALIVQPGSAQASQIPIHFIWRSFSIRDRLDREFGDHGNQVMWRVGRGGLVPPAMVPLALGAMDRWLTALGADTSNGTRAQKVRAARPAAIADFCLLSTDEAQATRVIDPAVCDADPFLRPSSSPRQVAGGPLSENILKCALRAINADEYGNRLDAAQLARLAVVFPTGVCDWTKPGVGQQPAVSPLDYQGGPGGSPFGPAPVSTPVATAAANGPR